LVNSKKNYVINSRATTFICQLLNGVRKAAYFHADFWSSC